MINLKVIKITNIKTLVINNIVSVISSFIAVLIIWNNYNFDINTSVLWFIYPLYLCGDYFINVHKEFLVYEEDLNSDIIEEAVC